MPAALLPALFPPVVYMGWLSREEVAIQLNASWEKRTWLNRFRIEAANGPTDLTARVSRQTTKGTLKEVRLDYTENWTIKEWRSLVSAYKNAPFFEALAEDLESIIVKQHNFLVDRIVDAMNWSCDYLQIKPAFIEDDSVPISYDKIGPNKAVDALPYPQVFQQKRPFQSNMSIIDLLMNEGPLAYDHLEQQNRLLPINLLTETDEA